MDPRDGQMYFEELTPPQQSLFDADSQDEPVDRADSTAYVELLEPFEDWLPDLFSYWSGGSEQGWARAAWEALGRRGLLTKAEEEADFIVALNNAALLVTLSAINSRFQGIRNGEGRAAPGTGRIRTSTRPT